MSFSFSTFIVAIAIALPLSLFLSQFLIFSIAVQPGAVTSEKNYYDCKEPGFFSSGRQEGKQCYTNSYIVNPPYDKELTKMKIIFIIFAPVALGIISGFFLDPGLGKWNFSNKSKKQEVQK